MGKHDWYFDNLSLYFKCQNEGCAHYCSPGTLIENPRYLLVNDCFDVPAEPPAVPEERPIVNKYTDVDNLLELIGDNTRDILQLRDCVAWLMKERER